MSQIVNFSIYEGFSAVDKTMGGNAGELVRCQLCSSNRGDLDYAEVEHSVHTHPSI